MSLRLLARQSALLPAGRQPRRNEPLTGSLSVSRRQFSSNQQQPRFQIPAHVAAFSLLMLPALAFFAYAEHYGPDKEELEATLRERYGKPPSVDQVKQSQAMSEFFQKAIMKPNGEVDAALNEVLKAGKTSSAQETTRRALKTTSSLAASAPETADDSKKAVAGAKKTDNPPASERVLQAASGDAMKPKKKRKQKALAAATEPSHDEATSSSNETATKSFLSENLKFSLLVTGVAALAAGVGYIAGGKK